MSTEDAMRRELEGLALLREPTSRYTRCVWCRDWTDLGAICAPCRMTPYPYHLIGSREGA